MKGSSDKWVRPLQLSSSGHKEIFNWGGEEVAAAGRQAALGNCDWPRHIQWHVWHIRAGDRTDHRPHNNRLLPSNGFFVSRGEFKQNMPPDRERLRWLICLVAHLTLAVLSQGGVVADPPHTGAHVRVQGVEAGPRVPPVHHLTLTSQLISFVCCIREKAAETHSSDKSHISKYRQRLDFVSPCDLNVQPQTGTDTAIIKSRRITAINIIVIIALSCNFLQIQNET